MYQCSDAVLANVELDHLELYDGTHHRLSRNTANWYQNLEGQMANGAVTFGVEQRHVQENYESLLAHSSVQSENLSGKEDMILCRGITNERLGSRERRILTVVTLKLRPVP